MLGCSPGHLAWLPRPTQQGHSVPASAGRGGRLPQTCRELRRSFPCTGRLAPRGHLNDAVTEAAGLAELEQTERDTVKLPKRRQTRVARCTRRASCAARRFRHPAKGSDCVRVARTGPLPRTSPVQKCGPKALEHGRRGSSAAVAPSRHRSRGVPRDPGLTPRPNGTAPTRRTAAAGAPARQPGAQEAPCPVHGACRKPGEALSPTCRQDGGLRGDLRNQLRLLPQGWSCEESRGTGKSFT